MRLAENTGRDESQPLGDIVVADDEVRGFLRGFTAPTVWPSDPSYVTVFASRRRGSGSARDPGR